MACPKVLAAGTGTAPYPHTETSNINTTHNHAKPLCMHRLPVHWQCLTAASRQPSQRTGWSAHTLTSVRHTLATCQSRRAYELLDHEDHGLDGGDQLQPLGPPAGRAAAAEAVATADGRLEGHHAAPVRVHGGGRMSSLASSDCMAATQHDARCRVCRPHLSGLLRCRAGLAMYPHCSRSRRLNVLCTFCPTSFVISSQRTKLSRLTRGAYCVFLISREGTLRLRTHTETLATAFLEPHSQAAVTPAPQLL